MLSPVSGCNLTFGTVKIEDTVKKSVSSETLISFCRKQHIKYIYHSFLLVSTVQILNGKKLYAL